MARFLHLQSPQTSIISSFSDHDSPVSLSHLYGCLWIHSAYLDDPGYTSHLKVLTSVISNLRQTGIYSQVLRIRMWTFWESIVLIAIRNTLFHTQNALEYSIHAIKYSCMSSSICSVTPPGKVTPFLLPAMVGSDPALRTPGKFYCHCYHPLWQWGQVT